MSNDNGKMLIDILTHHIKKILGLAHIKERKIHVVIDMPDFHPKSTYKWLFAERNDKEKIRNVIL